MSMPELSATRTQATDPFAQTFRRTEAIAIPERGTHIPTWYTPHESPETIVVKSGGIPLRPVAAGDGWQPFTVADVAPELRWAIKPDGEVLPQHEFDVLYIRKIEEFYRVVEGRGYPGNVQREHIPRVDRYVSYTVDRTNPARYAPIGYEPHPKNAQTASVLFDSDGENPVSGEERMALLEKCYDDPRLRRRLKPHEIAEVERRRKDDPLALAMAELRAGKIDADEFQRRVQATLGTQALIETARERKAQKPRPKPSKKKMTCGAEIFSVQIARHRKDCQVCGALASGETA